jgi:hypothetical protein
MLGAHQTPDEQTLCIGKRLKNKGDICGMQIVD